MAKKKKIKPMKKNAKPIENLIIPKVMVAPDVVNMIKEETLKYGSFETGGLLIGEKSMMNNEYSIVVRKATGPGNKSQHSTHNFIPDVEHYQSEMRTELYRNGIIYVGEWHKHPGAFDQPSGTDLDTMKQITSDDNTKDVLAVIATKPGYNGSANDANKVKTNFYYYQRGMKNFIPIIPEIISTPPLKKKVKKIEKINLNVEYLLKLFEKGKGSIMVEGDIKDSGVLNMVLIKKYDSPVNAEIIFANSDDQTIDLNSKGDIVVVVSIEKTNISATGWQMDENTGEFNKIEVEMIDLKDSLFKRLGGLEIQENILDKKVVMVGVGSVGSTASAQLVKAGIRDLVLIDPDQLEVHNIIRHLCDLDDLGRYKTDAVADRLKKINPAVNLQLFKEDFVQDFEKIEKSISDADILIVSTDTPDSRQVTNMVSIEKKIPTVYISLHERAMTGSVYRVVPGKTGCRNCLGDGQWNSEFIPGTTEYSEATDERDILFQPGMDSDITLVTLLGVKMVLSSLLNPKLKILPDLGANYIHWNGYPGKKGAMARLIPAGIPKNKECDVCGKKPKSTIEQNNVHAEDII